MQLTPETESALARLAPTLAKLPDTSDYNAIAGALEDARRDVHAKDVERSKFDDSMSMIRRAGAFDTQTEAKASAALLDACRDWLAYIDSDAEDNARQGKILAEMRYAVKQATPRTSRYSF